MPSEDISLHVTLFILAIDRPVSEISNIATPGCLPNYHSYSSTMAETDLSLLNKVELRFALAKTDEKLSSMVASFLPPVLLKLASPYTEVRDKVVEICQHINVRINSK